MLLVDRTTESPSRAMLDATRTLLSELSVELRLASRSSPYELAATTQLARAALQHEDALAAAWLEIEGVNVVVYFYERAHGRLLTRTVEVSESEAARAEEVAVVLRSAVGALLEGGEPMMTEVVVPTAPKPPPPRVTPKPVPRRDDPARAELLLGYTGELVSSDVAWQSGARAALSLGPRASRLRGGLGFSWFPAFRHDNTAASVEVSRYPVDVWLGMGFGSQRFSLRPELGVLAEYVRRSTLRAASNLSPEQASGRWLWAATARLRGFCAVSPRLRLFAAGGIELFPAPHDEIALGSQGETLLFAWSALRPVAEAGISLQIW